MRDTQTGFPWSMAFRVRFITNDDDFSQFMGVLNYFSTSPVVPGLTRNPSLSIDSRLRGNDGQGRHYAVNSVVSNLFRTFSPPVRALNYHCVGYIIYGCPELLLPRHSGERQIP